MFTPGAGPTLMTQRPGRDNISNPRSTPKSNIPDADSCGAARGE